ncbi:MAG: NgoPII family restriction endonuclease [Methylococcales bacterium]|jgi:NgoPII restriction endonuclease
MTTTNLLVAIKNIITNPITNLTGHYNSSSNRVNSEGEALENYIKDIFCGTVNTTDENQRNQVFSEHFSYLGNQNNPPDIMICGGDAIEVKKMESNSSGIALNSSYPKDVLYANSPMLTEECKACETWTQKDLLYSIGVAPNGKLKSLWFVYGDCYAANKSIYEKIKNAISNGIQNLRDIEFAETKELGRVNRVDPLGITYLRIRGMWHIDNPSKVFQYVAPQLNAGFSLYALLLEGKYNSFPQADRSMIEQLNISGFSITKVKIKSPNNPATLLDARLISFEKLK